ncbi:MAG: right-handed parallel beta-helix repeat-containing protein [Alphaproteobacteria bacterium]|nr:right-handed parallel beta-helix repeat-containing protein [Alphaproteobacteria bacterium]
MRPMLLPVLVVGGLAAAAPASAATTIAGGNLGNQTWTLAGSPYTVNGDATVQAGATLTIEAGVVVRFASSDASAAGVDTNRVELTIAGALQVDGTEAEPVTFEGVSATASSWYGLVVATGASSVELHHVEMAHGTYGVRGGEDWTGTDVTVRTTGTAGVIQTHGRATLTGYVATAGRYGAQTTSDGTLALTDCLIHHNSSYGLNLTNSSATSHTLDHCTIADNANLGIYANNGSTGNINVAITASIITHNTNGGVYDYRYGVFTLSRSLVWENGVTLNTNDETQGTVTFSTPNLVADPLFVNRAAGDYRLTSRSPARFGDASNGDLGARPYDGVATTTWQGTLWTDTTMPTGVSNIVGDLTVPPGVRLTVPADAELVFATTDASKAYDDLNRVELRVAGGLTVQGTEGHEATFRSSSTASSSWYGIRLLPSAAAGVISHAVILDAIYGVHYEATLATPMDHLYVADCGTAGLRVSAGEIDLSDSELTGNRYALYATNSGTFDARRSILHRNTSYAVYLVNDRAVSHTVDRLTIADNANYGIYGNNGSTGNIALAVRNSIVTGNTNGGIYDYRYLVVTASNTNVWENGVSLNTNDEVQGTVTFSTPNLAVNPEYVNAAQADYALLDRSPARFAASDGGDIGAVPYDGVLSTQWHGTLWTDTTLPAGITNITGDLTVAPGVTLTAMPGADLVFASTDATKAHEDLNKIELRVEGTLWLLGLSHANPVTLRHTAGTASGWYGIHLLPSASGGLLDFAHIEDAIYGVRYDANAANTLDDLRITNAGTAGVRVSAGEAPISDLEVTDSRYGIYTVQGGTVDVDRCLLHHNSSYAVYLANDRAVSQSFDHCTIANNANYGLYANNGSTGNINVAVVDSLVTQNTNGGVYDYRYGVFTLTRTSVWENGVSLNTNDEAQGTVTFATPNLVANPLYVDAAHGDYALTSRSPQRFGGAGRSDMGAVPYAGVVSPGMSGTLWGDTTFAAGVTTIDGDLTVPGGITLTVSPGATLRFASSDSAKGFDDLNKVELRVFGSLAADATPALPATFAGVSTADGSWDGIHFMSGAGGTLRNLQVFDAVVGLEYDDSTPALDGALISGSSTSAVRINAGTVALDRLRAVDNRRAVYTTGAGVVHLSNALITSNTTDGVYFANDRATSHTVVNCTIDGNGAYGLYGNNGSTGNISVSVVNTAISNHTSYGVYDYRYAVYTLDHCNLWGNATATGGTVTNTSGLATNPQYLSASDFHLAASSPLVDAGRSSGAPSVDVDGRPRPVDGDGVGGAAYDIGAYEFQNVFPGISLTPNAADLDESGEQQVVDVVLDTAPLAGVTLAITSNDTSEATVTPSSLSFDSGNWDHPQSITITSVDDPDDDGDRAVQIRLDPSGSADLDYRNVATAVVATTVRDDDATRIVVTPSTGLVTTEAGATQVVSVSLDARPTASVRLDLSSSDTSEGTVFPPVMTFSTTDWNQPKTVTLTGVDDGVTDGDVVWQLRLDPGLSSAPAYAALPIKLVDVTNRDDDTVVPEVIVTGGSLVTTEAGGTATFSVVLGGLPTDDVHIALASSDPDEATVSTPSLDFTPQTYHQPITVTVTGVNDDVDDGDQAFEITLGPITSNDTGYAALVLGDTVAGVNTDDDTAGFLVSKAAVGTDETGLVDTFTVRLTSAPTATVSLAVASTDTDEATTSVASLSWDATSWTTARPVTVTGVDDDLVDGTVSYQITLGPVTSGDALYAALDPADLVGENVDDDVADLDLSTDALTTSETGTTATLSVALTAEPAGEVTVDVDLDDPSEGTAAPLQLTFLPGDWDEPQDVVVTGLDDSLVDGDVTYGLTLTVSSTADAAFDALADTVVPVTNTDDDGAGLVLSRRALTTSETGTTASFTVALSARPTGDVVVDLTGVDPTEGSVAPLQLTFGTGTWDQGQDVVVTGVDDSLLDGDVTYTLTLATSSAADATFDAVADTTVSVTNVDDDRAAFVVDPTAGVVVSETGTTATISVTLTSAPSADVTVDVRSSDPSEGSVSPAQLVFAVATWSQPRTITVTGVDDSLADGPVDYTVILDPAQSADATWNGVDPADVAVRTTDDEGGPALVLSVTTATVTEAGGTATVSLSLATQPTADVVVTLAGSDPSEGTISPTTVTITPAQWSQPHTVTITGVDDSLVDGDVAWTVDVTAIASADAAYDGLHLTQPARVTVTTTDDDAPGLLLSRTSGLVVTEAGSTDTFTVALRSRPSADVQLTFGASDPSEGSVSPITVSIAPATWDQPRTVTVTGVDDAVDDGDVAWQVTLDGVASADTAYDGLHLIQPASVGVTTTDDDTAGVLLSRTSGLVVTEAGSADTFTVVLTSQPTATVNLGLESSDLSEGLVSPTALDFDSTTWSTPRTVTVTGRDDAIVDGDVAWVVRTLAITSLDGRYAGLDADDVAVTTLDDDSVIPVDTDTDGDTDDTDDSDAVVDTDDTDDSDTVVDTDDTDGPAETDTDTDTGDPDEGKDTGCACDPRGGAPTAWWVVVMAGVMGVRRRRCR